MSSPPPHVLQESIFRAAATEQLKHKWKILKVYWWLPFPKRKSFRHSSPSPPYHNPPKLLSSGFTFCPPTLPLDSFLLSSNMLNRLLQRTTLAPEVQWILFFLFFISFLFFPPKCHLFTEVLSKHPPISNCTFYLLHSGVYHSYFLFLFYYFIHSTYYFLKYYIFH